MAFWNSVFHNVFGVAHIRLPLMLSIPIAYKFFIDTGVDNWFMAANAGATQKDIWDRLEKRAQESPVEAEDA